MADQNYYNRALLLAAKLGKAREAEAAITSGANVKSEWGSEALMHASKRGHLEVVKILVANGADVNFKTATDRIQYQETPLILAASWGHAEIAKILIEKGAHVDFRPGKGMTALECAIRFGREKVVDLLVKAGGIPPPKVEPAVYDIDEFLQLPSKTDALDKFTAILGQSCWRVTGMDFSRLTAEESAVYFVWDFSLTFVMDGLKDYFFNGNSYFSRKLIEGLGIIGWIEVKTILEEACQIFPGGVLPQDEREFYRVITSLTPRQIMFLDTLEEKFNEVVDENSIDEVLHKYILANHAKFKQKCPK